MPRLTFVANVEGARGRKDEQGAEERKDTRKRGPPQGAYDQRNPRVETITASVTITAMTNPIVVGRRMFGFGGKAGKFPFDQRSARARIPEARGTIAVRGPPVSRFVWELWKTEPLRALAAPCLTPNQYRCDPLAFREGDSHPIPRSERQFQGRNVEARIWRAFNRSS